MTTLRGGQRAAETQGVRLPQPGRWSGKAPLDVWAGFSFRKRRVNGGGNEGKCPRQREQHVQRQGGREHTAHSGSIQLRKSAWLEPRNGTGWGH